MHRPSKTFPRQLIADLALLACTAAWGSSFVLIKDAVGQYPAFPFLVLRFGLATLVLLPAAWPARRSWRWSDLPTGVALGVLLFAGMAFQTLGLRETQASKSAFITGLAVVITPLLFALLSRRLPSWQAVAGALLATLGLALLSLNDDLAIQRGNLLTLACAVSFSCHIIGLSLLSPRRDPRLLALVQTATVAILSSIPSALQGGFQSLPASVLAAAAYVGLVATAVPFVVQTLAQQFTTANHTALMMSAEPVFAAAFSMLLTGERLPSRGWLGCAAILLGVLLGALAPASLPETGDASAGAAVEGTS